MKGLVLKSTGSWYQVKGEDGRIYPCKIKGLFKIKGLVTTNPVAVGDIVEFKEEPGNETPIIHTVQPRKNYIIRKSVKLSKQAHIIAANIDRAFLIVSLVAPRTSMGFIDRFLVTAEGYGIPAVLVLNKWDLYEESLIKQAEEVHSIYNPLGYPCINISAEKGYNLDNLKKELNKGVNLLSGHSGVGKSTLINALVPSLRLRTGEISLQHLKGTHTTTFAEMFDLPEGGTIIDTPGIRDFGVIDFLPEEISHFFPEMRERLNQCQFNNCLHDHEPNCAIKDAVAKGDIHPSRYYNYLSILRNEDKFN